jgi:hypothetical protein
LLLKRKRPFAYICVLGLISDWRGKVQFNKTQKESRRSQGANLLIILEVTDDSFQNIDAPKQQTREKRKTSKPDTWSKEAGGEDETDSELLSVL